MPNDWISNSTLVAGLILEDIQSDVPFNPEWFVEPYNKVVNDKKKGKSLSELMNLHGTSTVQSALTAAHSVNGLGKSADWVSVLQESYRLEQNGQILQKISKQMLRGQAPKIEDIRSVLDNLNGAVKSKAMRGDEIEENYEPYLPSGSLAIDTHMVGLPNVGTYIIGAKTFTGKTTVAITLAANFLIKHPDRELLFVCLEDMAAGWKNRAKILLGEDLWRRLASRFIVLEVANNVEDIIAEVSKYPNVGHVILDYIDYLVGDASFEAYNAAYLKLSKASKALATLTSHKSMPIGILAQFSKGQYKGGVPQPKHSMYTGDAGAYQIFMLYNPNNDWYGEDGETDARGKKKDPEFVLPAIPNRAYIVCWKSKAGFRNHVNDFPGAISVPWSPRYGFDLNDTGEWYSLAKG